MLAAGDIPVSLDYFGPLVNLGAVGIFLVLFLLGKIRRADEVADKDEEIRELKLTIKEYIEHYQKDVLPALIDVTKVSGEVVTFLNKHRD